ncbi:hypothetical protein [Paenibacillus caui]|uniref:hypothetical protein n=1 Tax=Paenibacillus caui TaxID=2873927 RepID=UPI001CA9A5FC|nr:hypothetical protein [Paenibacillus caui]
MPNKFRSLIGAVLLLLSGIIAVIYYNMNSSYKIDEIPNDIVHRIYNSADGKGNIENLKIQESKKIGKYLVFLYSSILHNSVIEN